MGDLAVGAVAAFFAGMGLLALVRPEQVVDRFGIGLGGPDGRNEVRAVYGGFGIAVTAMLVVAIAAEGGFRDGVLVAFAASLAGMAAGRLVGFAVERPQRRWETPRWFVVELVLAGLLLVGVGG
jgi:hypothetical protein